MSVSAAMAFMEAAPVRNFAGGWSRNRGISLKFHPFPKSPEFLKAYRRRTDREMVKAGVDSPSASWPPPGTRKTPCGAPQEM
jgi:hypothetical protein